MQDEEEDDHSNDPQTTTDTADADPVEATKANLSRHVTSVISHFTSSKEGFRRLVNELDDFWHVIAPFPSTATSLASTRGPKILYASPSSHKHVGIQPDDLKNRFLLDILHPDDAPLLLSHIRAASSGTTMSAPASLSHAHPSTFNNTSSPLTPTPPGERPEYLAFVRFRRPNGEAVLMEVKGKPFPPHPSAGPVSYILHSCRTYRSKGSLSIDSIMELRLENLKLRKQLEEQLVARGVDPLKHPLLKGGGEGGIEVAPSAHPLELDEDGNVETVLTEEDFEDEDHLGAAFGAAGALSGMGGGGGYGGSGSSLGGAGKRKVLGGLEEDDDSGSEVGAKGDASVDPHVTSVAEALIADMGKPAKRKKIKVPPEELFCRQCGTTQSPEWRKGPLGPKTLCNACGLAYSKKIQKEKKRLLKLQEQGGGDGGQGSSSQGKKKGGGAEN
ncbi:blue light receptor [Chytridiales sp. JEL 0842]|nr:blue light receptor [Chytridiales sp. JEL 0842]